MIACSLTGTDLQPHEHDRRDPADGAGDEERDPAGRLHEPGARPRAAIGATALIDAGEIRLRPIVMTTLAMIFGMLPLALALGAGAEFRAPHGARRDRRA